MPTRRSLLLAAGTAGLAVAGACGLGSCTAGPTAPRGSGARCVARDELDLHPTIGPATLVYEEDHRARAFPFEAGFHAQLEAWLADWRADAGPLGAVTAIDTYGAWTDGGSACDSWHNSGRAFDIARLRAGDDALVSCRHDLWESLPAPERDAQRRAYWRLAAHLYARFAYVLTYLFDELHTNHIHVDNGVSGAARRTSFDSGSRVQNQMVQAGCTYVWDVPCPLSGAWDAETRRVSRTVLERIGVRGPLTDGDAWQRFLAATATRA